MQRKITFAPGEFYHLYNRGVNKSKIFFDAHDYYRLMMLLYLCNSDTHIHSQNVFRHGKKTSLEAILTSVFSTERGEQLVDIGAYCLMPNHFHILVKERMDGGVSLFMQKLGTAYTMYVNKRKTRTGTLYEGPFKATHVAEDNYLKYLYAYIHLNPIKLIDTQWKKNGIRNKGKAEAYLHKYQFSSYLDHLKVARRQNLIIETDSFPKYFNTEADFDNHIKYWLTFRSDYSIL